MKVKGMPSLDLALEVMKLARTEGMTQAEVCVATGASRSHVCRVVNKMAGMGYLETIERPVSTTRFTKFYRVAPAWKNER